MELISIIIPVYNNILTLKDTIQSVLNQTYQNFEILVVDDGSEVDIYSIVKLINDNRIIYHKLPHRNANFARNYGTLNSKGVYIAMLDADDLWLSNHLEDCLEFIKCTKADGVYSNLILKSNNREVKTWKYDEESMIDFLLRTGCGAQTSTLFLKTSCAKDILWDTELVRHQDYDFVVRFDKKYKLCRKEKSTVIYNNSFSDKKIDFESCIKFIEKNKKDISSDIYSFYCYKMLCKAIYLKSGDEVINYYKNELQFQF